ncbi:porin [Salmonella enterica subsp. enterica]|nr:porin [Salmonella enterica subsp. enterica]
MIKRASGLATYRNTDFFGIVDGLDLPYSIRGKRRSRCEKSKTARRPAHPVSYDFGGSAIAVSGALILSDRKL